MELENVVLKQKEEVRISDQFLAVFDFLKAMGVETENLTILQLAQVRHDIMKSIGLKKSEEE